MAWNRLLFECVRSWSTARSDLVQHRREWGVSTMPFALKPDQTQSVTNIMWNLLQYACIWLSPLLQWWLYIFYWHTIRPDMQFTYTSKSQIHGLECISSFHETLCSLLTLTMISTWVRNLNLVIWATECSNSTDHRTGNVHKCEHHCHYVAQSLMTFM